MKLILFVVSTVLIESSSLSSSSLSSLSSFSEPSLASKVVCVSWGTRNCNDYTGQCQLSESMGTGLYCTYRGRTGVLTNFHVLPTAEDTEPAKYGKVHFEYADRKKMTIQEMQENGIDMHAETFYFNGGQEASGYDWAFVCVDENEVTRCYPGVTPYDLEQSSAIPRAHRGDEITLFHHRGGEPLLEWHTIIDEDEGLQGTLEEAGMCRVDYPGMCSGDAPNHGSSGSPVWEGDKVIGVFWGELTQRDSYGHETKYNRFVTIQAVLEQLNQQIN